MSWHGHGASREGGLEKTLLDGQAARMSLERIGNEYRSPYPFSVSPSSSFKLDTFIYFYCYRRLMARNSRLLPSMTCSVKRSEGIMTTGKQGKYCSDPFLTLY